MEEKQRNLNKNLVKILQLIIKYIPFIIAFLNMLHNILNYFKVEYIYILNIIGGISILTLIFMYLSSYVFHFCWRHRLPLHYILINNIFSWYDDFIGLSIGDFEFLCISLFIFGLFIILYVKSERNCRRLS